MVFTGNQILQPMMVVRATCPCCGRQFESAPVAQERIRRVLRGEHVQDVFPEWTPAERELFLMTGICEACWSKDEGEGGE